MATTAGNGRALRPMRWWQMPYRTVFGIVHAGHRYVVDARLLAENARLYVDGVQTARADLPARFAVDGGRIEVKASSYGLQRMHLVRDDGTQSQLVPAPRTAERWRADLARRRPVLSRVMAGTAVVVLLAGLVVGLPQVAEWVTGIDVVAERLGTFTSPFDVPGWLGTTLTVSGVLAGIERALTLRHHWLIDLETSWAD